MVSAEKKDGRIVSTRILSEKGGRLRVISPFTEEVIDRPTEAGELIVLDK